MFLIWANPGLFLFTFILFTLQFKLKNQSFGFDSGPQDGRRRLIHSAIAAAKYFKMLMAFHILSSFQSRIIVLLK